MKDYKKEYESKLVSCSEAAKTIKDGDNVFLGLSSSYAYSMADAIWDRRHELNDVTLQVFDVLSQDEMFKETVGNPFKFMTPFLGPGERAAISCGQNIKFSSMHVSDFHLFYTEIAKANVAVFNVSLPDEDGNFSFGPAGGAINAPVLETAERIIVQVNKKTPYAYGEVCSINIKDVDLIVESDDEVPTYKEGEVGETAKEIAKHIIPLIPDAATIQLGIGAVSQAVAYGLKEKNDLGIFTELYADVMMDLTKNGNVTNKKKGFMDGISVYGDAFGRSELYDYINYNKEMYSATFKFVNDVRNISKNKRMISINSAMSMNLYGEIASEAMAFRQYSGIGGQVDFVRGAQMSEGGKSFLAMTSTFVKNGERKSRIVLDFPMGTPTTTSRADVQYVATEFGCVNLKTLTLQDRTRAIIGLAHPDYRDQLTEEAKRYGLFK